MANAVVTSNLTTDLTTSPDVTQTYFRKVLLDRAMYYNYHARWADPIPLPQNEGRNVIVRRYLHLAMALSPLTEAVPPSGKTPALDDFQANLSQFGDFIALSDLARWTQKDPVLNHWTGLLGEQAGYTIDAVDRDTAVAGTTVIYTNGTARTAVTSVVDGNDLDRAERTLIVNGAETLVGGTPAASQEGVYSTMPAYPCITSPYVLFTLQNLGGGSKKWRWPSDYKSGNEGEMGRYGMLAFYVSADPSSLTAGAKVFLDGGGTANSLVRSNLGTSADVHTILIFGKHGFSTVNLNGKNTTYHVKGVGTSGVYDPIDQVGSTGWKSISARLRTNENWIARIETAVEN